MVKHKYIEAVNRKLSWERHNVASPRHSGFKGFMCSAWRGQDSSPGEQWVDVGQLKKPRGIEDVEQDAFDKLLDRKDGLYDRVRSRSRIWLMSANNAINPILSSTNIQKDTPRRTAYGQEDFERRFQRFQSQQTSETDHAYEIDPITNRKVFKNKTSKNTRKPIDVPVNTFKGYRSQFQDFGPPASQPRKPEKPCPVKEGLMDYDKKTGYGPVLYREPDGKLPEESDPVRESLKKYEQENPVGAVRYREPDGKLPEEPDMVRESLKAYEETHPVGAVRYREPDGKLPEEPDSVRESLKEYEKKRPVGAVRYQGPDGKLPEGTDSIRESLKEYGKKDCAGAVQYREPDGKRSEKLCPVQEGLKDYDCRTTYGPIMNSHPDEKSPPNDIHSPYNQGSWERPSQFETKAKENTLCPVQEGLKAYDSKVIYGTHLQNEADGKSPSNQDSMADGSRAYDEPTEHSNGPRRILKNIFLGSGNPKTDKSFRYSKEDTTEDLDLLRASDIRAASGIIKGAKKETEADKLTVRQRLEEEFQKEQDLHTSTCEDLSTTKTVKLKLKHEAQNKLMEELKIDSSELQNIQAHLKGRVNAALESVSAELPAMATGKKMTGNFVRDFPEEFETKWTAAQDSGTLKPDNEVTSQYVEPAPKESFARNLRTARIQPSLDRTATSGKDVNKNASFQNEIDSYSKLPRGLEISYPNEKAEEAKLQNERDPYSKRPMGLETSYADEVAEKRALELERDPYSKVPQGLETSYIDELKLQNEKDPYSKKPMGLETSYADEIAARQAEGDVLAGVSSFGRHNDSEEAKRARQLAKQEKKNRMKQMDRELVREIRSIYEEKYGILDSKHRQVPESAAVSEAATSTEAEPYTQEPTIYKILAYDPTMQEINTAETTSIVEDSATALTPAEVLLRLSNPAKFFPHFQPLQAEGYEIISGSGDVLVFRKVRSAGFQGSKSESATSIQNRKTTNPIDGMQSSPMAATGNFASPTGFVNHDLPVSEPPFKSNIDVRREEPVFSGKSNWQEGNASTSRKTKGRGKRLLIGAAWVAGCSYAIGVVVEFFRTGGIDGRGPQGF